MSDLTSMGKQLKALMRETLENGVILYKPKFQYFQRSYDEARERLAIELTRLLINTTYFDRATKLFIANMYMNKRDVAKELNNFGIAVCDSTVATRIRSDIARFVKDFGSNVIVDLFENTNTPVDKYQLKLERIMSKNNISKCELDSLRGLMIPVGTLSSDSIPDEKFDAFLDMIRPYTELGMRQVELKLDREVCGYARKLLSDGAFGDEQERHLEKLKLLLDTDIG